MKEHTTENFDLDAMALRLSSEMDRIAGEVHNMSVILNRVTERLRSLE
jgi:hypothetical protein